MFRKWCSREVIKQKTCTLASKIFSFYCLETVNCKTSDQIRDLIIKLVITAGVKLSKSFLNLKATEMKNSFPASRLDIDQDILGSTKIETITDLLLGEILADLEELILAHRSAAVFVHVLEHLDSYDKYDNYVPIPSLSRFRHHHELVVCSSLS